MHVPRIGALARLVKIEHSIFALPFAYLGFFLAKGGWPGIWPFALLTVGMVAMRSYAMGMNRILDLPLDRENPRTRGRELVTGEVGAGTAVGFVAGCAAVFVAVCYGINDLCFSLSWIPLVWGGLYSLTKRFTWACHFVLGSVLGLAPMAGWLTVEPTFSLPPILFGLGVTFWVAGFDILYACQDVDFDRGKGLWSVPARFGVGPALGLAAFSHVNAALFFLLAGYARGLSWVYYVFWGASAAALFVEHLLLSEKDLSRIDMAFFTLNGVVAVVLCLGAILSVWIGG